MSDVPNISFESLATRDLQALLQNARRTHRTAMADEVLAVLRARGLALPGEVPAPVAPEVVQPRSRVGRNVAVAVALGVGALILLAPTLSGLLTRDDVAPPPAPMALTTTPRAMTAVVEAGGPPVAAPVGQPPSLAPLQVERKVEAPALAALPRPPTARVVAEAQIDEPPKTGGRLLAASGSGMALTTPCDRRLQPSDRTGCGPDGEAVRAQFPARQFSMAVNANARSAPPGSAGRGGGAAAPR